MSERRRSDGQLLVTWKRVLEYLKKMPDNLLDQPVSIHAGIPIHLHTTPTAEKLQQLEEIDQKYIGYQLDVIGLIITDILDNEDSTDDCDECKKCACHSPNGSLALRADMQVSNKFKPFVVPDSVITGESGIEEENK